MSGRTFLDTNVLVYAQDGSEPEKKARAIEILREVASAGNAAISTQVLQEFYVTVTRKLDPPIEPEDAERLVHDLATWPVVLLDVSMVREAMATSRRYQLSLWDALILRAAIRGGCSELLSEDLQAGFSIEGTTVVNPFAARTGP